MGREVGAPYPWDVLINGVGYMTVRGADAGAPPIETPVDSPPGARGEETILREDFSGGIGQPRSRNIPETDHSLYTTGAVADFGGADSSWGVVVPPPEVTSVTIDSNETCRSILPRRFSVDGAAYAAFDNKLYRSTIGDWSDSTLVYTATGNIERLIEFQGTNSVPLMWIAVNTGAYVTFDGTTFSLDSPVSLRSEKPIAFYVTVDGGATYRDDTSVTTDDNAATGSNLSLLNTLAQLDWVIVAFPEPFTALALTVPTPNGTVSVMSGSYWGTSGWTALSGFTDGTINAGATLGQNGTISWTRPAAQWVKTVLAPNIQSPAAYYIRLVVSVQLDASVSVASALCNFAAEASDFEVNGSNELWRTFSVNKRARTETGGRQAVWLGRGDDEIGDGTMTVQGMVAVGGVMYVKTDRGLAALDTDGSNLPYLPHLFSNPSTAGEGVMVPFGSEAWFSHENTFYRLRPPSAEAAGPERFSVSDDEAIAVRMTAAAAHEEHFLYCFGYNAAGKTYLYKQGSFKLLPNQESGNLEWVRTDGWHLVQHWGSRKVTAAAVYLIGTQPYLFGAATNGVMYMARLPKGVSGLDPNSGVRWSTIGGYMQFPSFYGFDEAKEVIAVAWTLVARGLTANITAILQTKAPSASVWVDQGTATTPNGVRTNFTVDHVGFGMDWRLKLITNSATVPWIIDSISLHFHQPMRTTQKFYPYVVLADDGVVDKMGRQIHWTANDWASALRTAAALKTPYAHVDPFGNTDTVLMKKLDEADQPSRQRHARRRAFSVWLASA